MASFSFASDPMDPTIFARWAFERVIDAARTHVTDPNLLDRLTRAVALDGLHFEMVDTDQVMPLIDAVRAGVGDVSSQLERSSREPVDESFLWALKHLDLKLARERVTFSDAD